jgi:hypothetical protein
MACPQTCSDTGIYKFRAISYGKPAPTHVNLIVRQNGQFQNMPVGYMIPGGQVEITGVFPVVQTPPAV